MAEEEINVIMHDLQQHLRTAQIPLANLSTITRKGDEKEIKFVEKFISESISGHGAAESGDMSTSQDALQSQLYIACFWGFRDIVQAILRLSEQRGLDINVNNRNKGSLWTPLHCATFQEHGPIIMLLLQYGADPNLKDAEDRTAKDFASASDKVWGHFAALGLQRTPRSKLIEMGIIKQANINGGTSPHGGTSREPGSGITMADYSQASYTSDLDPYQTAAMTGDVLANHEEGELQRSQPPQFAAYK